MELEKNRNTTNAFNQLISDFKILTDTSVTLLNETKDFNAEFETARKFLIDTVFEDFAKNLKIVREALVNLENKTKTAKPAKKAA